MRRETTRTHPSDRAVYARSRVAAGSWNPQNLGDCDTVYARSRVAASECGGAGGDTLISHDKAGFWLDRRAKGRLRLFVRSTNRSSRVLAGTGMADVRWAKADGLVGSGWEWRRDEIRWAHGLIGQKAYGQSSMDRLMGTG